MTGSNSYRPRHSHPINGLSLIPQHVLNSNRNTPSPRLSRPAVDPFKAFTANDLDGFVDSITSKIRNALLGNTPTDPQPKTKAHSRSSDVFGKLEPIQASNHSDLDPRPGPSGSHNRSPGRSLDNTVPAGEENDTDDESDDGGSGSNSESSIQSKDKRDAHIDIDSDDDILVSPNRRSPVARQTSQSGYSGSDADSDAANAHSESDDRHSDSSSDRGPASQEFSAYSSSFLNDNVSNDQEDIVSIEDSNISNSSNSSNSLQILSRIEPGREQAPKELGDQAEIDSSSSSIVVQPRHSEPKSPTSKQSFSPGAGPSRELGASKLPEKELEEGEIEEGELVQEDDADLDLRDDQEKLVPGDISVTEPFVSAPEKPQDLDQNIHPAFRQQESANVIQQSDDHTFGPKIVDQPSDMNPLVLSVAKIGNLSRTGSFSADGAMIFRPSSESSMSLDSDQGAEEAHDFDKTEAPGDVDGSPIIEHGPHSADQSQSSPSRVLDQSQPQLSYRPEIQCADSELVQDVYFLPINPASEPKRDPDEAKVGNELVSGEMRIKIQEANPDSHGATQVVSPVLDPREVQSAPNSTENPLEEEQVEDDNDLFEGDEDLRLHRLGLEKSRLNDSNQTEEAAPPSEGGDRCVTIENELESFLARTTEPQLSEAADRTHATVRELLHSLAACNGTALTTNSSAADHTVVQQPLEADRHAVDRSADLTVVQDDHSMTATTETLQQDLVVTQTDNVPVSTVNEAQLCTSPGVHTAAHGASETDRHAMDNFAAPTVVQNSHLMTASAEILQQDLVVTQAHNTLASTVDAAQADQVDPARPSIDVLWGEITSSQVTEESRMNEVDFFPLKPSDPTISNAASWSPALSANIANNPDHARTDLDGSTDVKSPIISLTLPQRSNLRQSVNLDADANSTGAAPKAFPGDQNLPSTIDPQQLSLSHDQEDYDMLASSLADGNSDIVPADSKEDPGKAACDQHVKMASDESLEPQSADKTHEDKPQDEKPLVSDKPIQNELGVDNDQSIQSTQLALPHCENTVGSPSPSKEPISTTEESDQMLSEFINSSPEAEDGPKLFDPPAPVSPTHSTTIVPAVTFATSPPVEMDRFERFDHQSDADETQLGVVLNVEQPNSAFEPLTPRTSTTVGQGTSSECSERHLSRGSAYSAPSSVISSDAASVPASVGPPPPLHNASMGAPTEAVGLSNQMTRRSSIDSSTHAEPPSPSTSTRQRSAPMSQEQVNAPGLPHIEETDVAFSPDDLPDPLRSPPPLNQQLLPICPAEINTPVSRASSMMAHPPSPSFSNLLEGSHMSIGTSHRDASPQFDPTLSLPDPIATPLPVSVPAIKLEDLPNACLSIERHRSLNSSADSQPATSPRFEKFSSSMIAPPQSADALIEKNVQAVGEINSSDTKAPLPSPTHPMATHPEEPNGSLSPPTSKVLDTDKPSQQSPEPPIPVLNSQDPQSQPAENEKDGQISNEKDNPELRSPLPATSPQTPGVTSDLAPPLVDEQVASKQDLTITETATHLPDVREDRATKELANAILDVQPGSTVDEEVVHVEIKPDTVEDREVDPKVDAEPDSAAGESQNPSELVEPPESPSQLGPTTRNKRKRQSPPKDPNGAARLREMKAEEQAEQDRESQLREILRKRRASKQLAPQAVPESKETEKPINQVSPSVESKKKKIVKRETKPVQGDGNSEGELESNNASDATEVESKGPLIRSSLPRAAKRTSMAPNSLAPPALIKSPSNATTRSASPRPPPSSPFNTHIGEQSSNSFLVSERDDPSLTVGNRRSSRNSRSTLSPVAPASTVSVMVPRLQPEDLIPKLRLHQHNSKNKLFNLQTEHPNLESSQQSSAEGTEPKPVVGVRTGRRKQSEGTEARQLPPSLPPVTRSHCHFIRLQFPQAAGRRFDTFLVPQCATGEEVIKKKMKEMGMAEDDNLTGEEQSRGIRIGPDGHKHSEERIEHPVLLTIKPEYSTFAVDEETLNILIEIFGLSLIQDGQVEVLLPKSYFSRFDAEDGYEELGDPLQRSECDRELSFSSLSSRNEPHLSHGGASQAGPSRSSHNRRKRRAQSPPSSLYSRASSPRSSSFLSPTEPKTHHKRRRSNQVEET
ncbi:hypothetical protein PtA15_6A194 [Puccinia triticina]|uniref:Uncharacterized protein n=1 Tax=Puccinia triticina TaxID=208348 RepID=A0ABY7CK03_9BASI|nr:uncharacterized protein PtA15_6A194 [Puccinia triticina]WAQ85566.1 hypothetical protein PtA15_6A194 [Puccinia triticina]